MVVDQTMSAACCTSTHQAKALPSLSTSRTSASELGRMRIIQATSRSLNSILNGVHYSTGRASVDVALFTRTCINCHMYAAKKKKRQYTPKEPLKINMVKICSKGE